MPKSRKTAALMPLRTLVILCLAVLPAIAAGVVAHHSLPPSAALSSVATVGAALGAWVAAASALNQFVE